MSDFKQNPVSSTVWPWTQAAQKAVQPTRWPRKARAVLQTVFMLVVALLVYKFTRHGVVMGKVITGLAGVVLVSGLFIPAVFDAIERFGQWLGRGVAVALTWGLLVPFYYLCFVPGRAVLALRGVDPMQRRFPTGDPTYWYPRPPVKDPNQYRKQH